MAMTRNTFIGVATFGLMASAFFAFGPAGLPIATALLWGGFLTICGLAIMALSDNNEDAGPSQRARRHTVVLEEEEVKVYRWYKPSTWHRHEVHHRSPPTATHTTTRNQGPMWNNNHVFPTDKPAKKVRTEFRPATPQAEKTVKHVASEFHPATTSNHQGGSCCAKPVTPSYETKRTTTTPTASSKVTHTGSTFVPASSKVTHTGSTFVPASNTTSTHTGEVKHTSSTFVPRI